MVGVGLSHAFVTEFVELGCLMPLLLSLLNWVPLCSVRWGVHRASTCQHRHLASTCRALGMNPFSGTLPTSLGRLAALRDL